MSNENVTSGTATTNMLLLKEVRGQFPDLPKQVLLRAVAAGLVFSDLDPDRPKLRRYHVEDVARLKALQEKKASAGEPKDLIDDGPRGVWKWMKHPSIKDGIRQTMRRILRIPVEQRPDELRDIKVRSEEGVSHGRFYSRDYVKETDVAAVIKFISIDTPTPSKDDEWQTFQQARRMGFDISFLQKYSGAADPKKTRPILSHPKIGCPIRRRRVLVSRNGGLRWRAEFWREHLIALREYVRREGWVTRREAYDIGVSDDTIEANRDPDSKNKRSPTPAAWEPQRNYAALGGRPLREKTFPVVSKKHRPTKLIHFNRADIERLSRHQNLPRPGSVERVYVDGTGKRWWPLMETADRIGVSTWDVIHWREDGYEHLPGNRPIHSQTITTAVLVGSKHPAPRFYSEADADAIKAAINGWADPKPAPARVQLIDDHPPVVARLESEARRFDPATTPIDGPHPPNKLWRNGKDVEVVPTPWRLINALFRLKDHTGMTEDVAAEVWGEAHPTGNAINAAIGKANKALSDLGFPVSISQKNGYFVLN